MQRNALIAIVASVLLLSGCVSQKNIQRIQAHDGIWKLKRDFGDQVVSDNQAIIAIDRFGSEEPRSARIAFAEGIVVDNMRVCGQNHFSNNKQIFSGGIQTYERCNTSNINEKGMPDYCGERKDTNANVIKDAFHLLGVSSINGRSMCVMVYLENSNSTKTPDQQKPSQDRVVVIFRPHDEYFDSLGRGGTPTGGSSQGTPRPTIVNPGVATPDD